MSNLLAVVVGLFLIGISVLIFTYGQVATFQYTDTGAGSLWENQTDMVKSTVGITQNITLWFPVLMFSLGIVSIYKGAN